MTKCSIVSVGLGVALAGSVFAKTIYVVPPGTSGNAPVSPYDSPACAANDLNTAFAAVESGDTVLVRKGRYDITRTLQITNSVLNRVTLRSYDPDNDNAINREETILDAENLPTSEYDGMIMVNSLDRKIQEITIDGFTFMNSRSRAILTYYSSSNRIVNCIFTNNTMTANIIPSDVKRYSNYSGGALALFAAPGNVVSNCIFVANTTGAGSGGSGGALYIHYHNGDTWANEAVDCTFTANYAAGYYGGGVTTSRARLNRCRFDGNKLRPKDGCGGQLYLDYHSVVENSFFTGESVSLYGTAIGIGALTNVVYNCQFRDLKATSLAPVISFTTALETNHVVKVENCTFSKLSGFNAVFAAGHFLTLQPYKAYIRNCLLYDFGSTIPVTSSGPTWGIHHFEHCTIDKPSGSMSYSGSDCHVTNEWVNCIFRGSTPSSSTALNVEDVRNCFTGDDPGFVSRENGDYRLYSRSVCLDRATPLDWHETGTDILGNPRQVGVAADLGCYERRVNEPHEVVRLVASEAEKTGDWADAETDWQTAVDAVSEVRDAELLVRGGTYRPSATIRVRAREATIRGEGAGTTILDGQNLHRIMCVDWGATVTNTSGGLTDLNPKDRTFVRLEGLTFRNGRSATDDGSIDAGQGGGLLFYGRASDKDGAPSVVADCRFENCWAQHGGGAATWGGFFTNCTFAGNVATNRGGGLACVQNRTTKMASGAYDLSTAWYMPSVIDCAFTNNCAERGGGICASRFDSPASAYVADCRFTGNLSIGAGMGGAGINGITASTVSNCLFVTNLASAINGYGILNCNSNMRGYDLTFRDNVVKYGVIYTTQTGNEFDRCTFVNNASDGAILGCGCTFRNTLIDQSQNSRYCLVKYLYNPLAFENCTLIGSGNVSPINFHSHTTNNVRFVNTIVWTPNASRALYNSYGEASYGGHAPQALAFTNCCLYIQPPAEDLTPVTGPTVLVNSFVSTRPGFVDAARGNWATRTSVCRDKGVKLGWMTGSARDVAGDPRVVTYGKTLEENPAALPDIGCYEYQLVPSSTILLVR